MHEVTMHHDTFCKTKLLYSQTTEQLHKTITLDEWLICLPIHISIQQQMFKYSFSVTVTSTTHWFTILIQHTQHTLI